MLDGGPDPPFERTILRTEGQLEQQERKFFYNGIRALEKRQTKCISVAGNYVEK